MESEYPVIICGAGIGGLTVAHELAKRGIRSMIIERNSQIGGLARSSYVNESGFTYPVEYSWRVYGTDYKNLKRILSEIPLQRNPRLNILNNLVQASTYILPRKKRPAVIFSPNQHQGSPEATFTFSDKIYTLDLLLTCLFMSTKRMDSMDHIRWNDYCHAFSTEAKKYLVKLWGPILGMDPLRVSFPAVARLFPIVAGAYTNQISSVYLMNQPTSQGWFDEWESFLTKTGLVTIVKNTEVKDFIVNEDSISHVVVKDLKNNKTSSLSADAFVCSMSVERIASIVEHNKDLSRLSSFRRTIPLAKKGHQIQVSVQLFLKERFDYPTSQPPILYLPDSPWALIIESQADVWGKTHSTDQTIHTVLSVGICQTEKPGIIHKKSFIHCTRSEIEDEVIAQIRASYKGSNIRMTTGEEFSRDHVDQFYLWHSFHYTSQTKTMDTWEPKFSNNAGTLPLMPKSETELKNFFFATGYTLTDRFLYSMESAAEAGIRCTNSLLKLLQPNNSYTAHVYPMLRPLLLLAPLRALDAILFSLKLPYLGKWFGNSIILLILYFLLPLILILILFLY